MAMLNHQRASDVVVYPVVNGGSKLYFMGSISEPLRVSQPSNSCDLWWSSWGVGVLENLEFDVDRCEMYDGILQKLIYYHLAGKLEVAPKCFPFHREPVLGIWISIAYIAPKLLGLLSR